MSFDIGKLYALLPAVYRIRDIELAKQIEGLLDEKEAAELQALQALLSSGSPLGEKQAKRLEELLEKKQRGPLKALLSVIAEQVAVLEEDLDRLYDDQFIETCAEWVVPYIGDLVGTRGLFVFPNAKFSQRAQVANTLAYRRRKGTAAVLEQLARDVTGWDSNVVEYFQLLATTQYMNHIRPENISIASVRRHFAGLFEPQSDESLTAANEYQWKALEYINTPFDKVTRTVDVRSIESQRGKYNIPNIGIFLWRLGSYSLTDAPAYSLDNRLYFLNPLGMDTTLYNKPETEDEITHLAEPINVPMPLSRRVLHKYLSTYYGRGKSLLINVGGQDITADNILVCDLSNTGPSTWAHVPPDNKYAIDPVLGRIALPGSLQFPTTVKVTFHYGFSAEMGGGEYGRAGTFDNKLQPVINVTKSPKVSSDKTTIQEALALLAASGGVVEIKDNEYYVETPIIDVPVGKKIELRAADERRPVVVLAGNLEIVGGENSEVTLNGLLISGSLRVPSKDGNNNENKLRLLRLRHCTLLPGSSPALMGMSSPPTTNSLVIEAPNVNVEIDRSIIGAIRVVDGSRIRITNSAMDTGAETEVAYAGLDNNGAGGPLEVENSTIIGRVHTSIMELASNTIFLASFNEGDSWPDPIAAKKAPILAERLQEGCVRFSYVPPGSQVPLQYHCQPRNIGEEARVRPVFTSLRYGDAGYCQLSQHCAVEIRQGADDEAEMGAFHDLYQPQRETNLRARLDEYLRFGLEAGIFYAT